MKGSTNVLSTSIGNLSDLTTTDKSSLVAAINEAAQGGESPSGIGTYVDVSSYSSSSNKYTFPSDGYLSVVAYSSSSYAELFLYGSNDVDFGDLSAEYGSHASKNELFVRKGMKCYVRTNTGNNVLRFYPIV